MKSIKPKLLLTPIDNKSSIKLANGQELILKTNLSQNAREALIQTGKVIASFNGKVQDYWTPSMWYFNELKPSDKVFCSHLTFSETTVDANNNYIEKDHVVIDGVKCFEVDYREIYFKFNEDKTIDMLGEYMLLEGIYDEAFTSTFLASPESHKKLNKIKARVVQTSKQIESQFKTGDEVHFIDAACLYKVEIDGNTFYRCRESEVVAVERLINA